MRRRISCLFLFAAATAMAACGGGNPAAPTGGNVVLDGIVLGGSAALPFHALSGASAAAEPIKVTVQGTTIETVVGADGAFVLRGLPAGGFVLVFTQGGATLGTLSFSEVKPNQEITITIAVASGSVTLVEQKRNGIGHGDLEIEGLVQQVLCGVAGSPACSTAGDSHFLIDGRTVVARPGQTAIREGNTARTVADVTVGRRVHVKGTWLPLEGSVQPVLAAEIKLQDDEDDDETFACVAGARAEVEGKISLKTGTTLTVSQTGKGLFDCDVPPGTPIRKGNTSYTFDQLQVGWRVHVKGTVVALLSTGACQVTASEVKVQQD
jgi:hypothetical protein